MLIAGLILSIAVPLFAGVPWLLLAWRDQSPGKWPIALSYGYVLGLLLIVGEMRLLSLASVPISLLSVSALPLASAAVGWWLAWRTLSTDFRPTLSSSRAAWRQMPAATRLASGAALALIVIRIATLAAESLARPLFPWEAVSSIASKARVWYEFGTLVPFVPPIAILQGLGSFTDADPSAFALPSLLMVWTAQAIGQWHEGAIAFPWVMLGIAVAVAFYGHLRHAGGGIAYSLVFTYALVSIPLIGVHIALSGAPQWVAAAGVGLAGCAFLRWLQVPTGGQLICVAIGAVLASLSLATTWPWLVIFVCAVAIERWPRLAGKLTVGVPLVILVVLLAMMQNPVTLGGRLFQIRLAAEWHETPESLLLLDNWHLLFAILLLIAIAGWRRMFSRSWRTRTWVVAVGLGLMGVKGALSLPPYWFGGLRDFSYAGLQLAPLLLMWIALLTKEEGALESRSQ